MAGTILHRILSKTKPAPAQTRLETTTAEISLDMAGTKTTSPRLSFEKPSGSRKSSLGQHKIPSMHNSRKHSYASVREEADLPQSFRTRRLSTDSELPNDRLPKPPLLSTKPEDEEAILDDASDVTPAASYDGADSFEEETLVRKPITLDSLPDEILDEIFCRIQLDTSQPLTDWLPRSDLFSCLSVSKSLHAAALRMLYKHVLICRSKTFWKMASNLQEDVELGSLIQTLDFSHYSHMGTGRSRSQTSETLYLTKDNLRAVLSHTRKLRNFLVHEHLDTELDAGVLSTLFSIPTLRAVDFTSCSHRTFLDAFSSLWLDSAPADYAQIRRLCLHECGTLKPQVFEAMLPRLDNLTHLDVAHTQIDDKALLSISKNARITHLNLERCTQLTGDAVVQFLTEHPAAKNTMIWLNLNADPSRHRLLSAENLHDLLPALPDTLRSLNIGGAKIVSEHVPALRQLACQLEELGIKGADLSLTEDIISILSVQPKKLDNLKSNLRYLDLTNIGSVTQMSLCYSPTSIIDSSSLPLEAIELGATVLTEIAKRQKNVRNPEWTVKELSRRGWYVRNPIPGTKRDDGYRSWKMGAHWWGMRKLPMVEQEVGDGIVRNYSITGWALGTGQGWVNGDVEQDDFWTPAGFHYGEILYRKDRKMVREAKRRRRAEFEIMRDKAREAQRLLQELPFCVLLKVERDERMAAMAAGRIDLPIEPDPIFDSEEVRSWILGGITGVRQEFTSRVIDDQYRRELVGLNRVEL